MSNVKLFFYYGTMGSSKTAQLLITSYNYTEKGKKVLLVKPKLDTREGNSIIKSRLGIEQPCIWFEELEQVIQSGNGESYLKPYDTVIVDEVQMLTSKQVMVLVDIVDNYNKPVLAYGLLSNFKGELFEGSAKLVAMADSLHEIKQICWCGSKAILNARFTSDGKIVREGEEFVIGSNDMYIGLCRKHYLLGELGLEI